MTDDSEDNDEEKKFEREEALIGHFSNAIEKIIKFSGITNGGGALAVVAVIGATAKSGSIENQLALPLAFFLCGLTCTLLLAMITFSAISNIASNKSVEDVGPFGKWIKIFSKHQQWINSGTFVFFLLGGVTSVIAIAFV